jgi:hypothetical protein
MIPSLGGIGLFKGNMITLCGRITHVPMIAHGASTEEEFEVIKFVDNSTPFSLLFGNPWIEKYQIRGKKKRKPQNRKRQESRDFITRKIARLVQEKEDKSKQQKVVEVERMKEGLQNMSMQERRAPTP